MLAGFGVGAHRLGHELPQFAPTEFAIAILIGCATQRLGKGPAQSAARLTANLHLVDLLMLLTGGQKGDVGQATGWYWRTGRRQILGRDGTVIADGARPQQPRPPK